MSATLTETSTFDATITVPAPGDARTAASVRAPFQGLANRTKYLNTQQQVLAAEVASVAGLSQIAGINWSAAQVPIIPTGSGGIVANPTGSQKLLLSYPNGAAWLGDGTLIVRCSTNAWGYSTDGGKTWAAFTNAPPLTVTDYQSGTLSGVAYLVAAGTSATLYKSSNLGGSSWASAGTASSNMTHVGRVDETWLAWGADSGSLHYSTNLTTWTLLTMPGGWAARTIFRPVSGDPGSGIKHILVPDSLTFASINDSVLVSTNGTSWALAAQTLDPTSGTVTVNGACFNPGLKEFMVTATSGDSWVSPDGDHWTHNPPSGVGLGRVRAIGSLYVACGASSGLYWSANSGVSWNLLHEYGTDGAWQDIAVWNGALVVGRHIDPSGADDHELEYKRSLRLPYGVI